MAHEHVQQYPTREGMRLDYDSGDEADSVMFQELPIFQILTRDPGVLDAHLVSPKAGVRQNTALLIVALAPMRPCEDQIETCLLSEDPHVRYAGVRAVEFSKLPELIPILDLVLEDEDPSVRGRVVSTLETLWYAESAQEVALRGLESEHTYTRRMCAQMLSLRALFSSLSRGIVDRVRPALFRVLTNDPEPSVRLAVAENLIITDPSLQMFGGSDVPTLLEARVDTDRFVRDAIQRALEAHPGVWNNDSPEVSAALEGDSPKQRHGALLLRASRVAGSPLTPADEQALRDGLDSSEPGVRAATIEWLTGPAGYKGLSRETLVRIYELAKDPHPMVRLEVCFALPRADKEEEALVPLKTLVKDPAPQVRRAAVQRLGKMIYTPGAATQVVPALEDPDYHVRAAARAALETLSLQERDALGIPPELP